jgi:hypothetical protein
MNQRAGLLGSALLLAYWQEDKLMEKSGKIQYNFYKNSMFTKSQLILG